MVRNKKQNKRLKYTRYKIKANTISENLQEVNTYYI